MQTHYCFIKNFILLAVLMSFFACSGNEPPKLDPGRCRLSKDCPQGQECRETRCQDLYYPRHKIKIN